MTETAHTRSRRAALGGLVLQVVAGGALLALYVATTSLAIYNAAWYVLGGVPIWFASLLVFRQRELAALEAMDLEELRRERQATGGGEAMFSAEGGGAGFRVAEARLKWMQRWLIPVFGLIVAVYLGALGFAEWRWLKFGTAPLVVGGPNWPVPDNVPLAMVFLAIAMLLLFLFSRYASGMGRIAEWQLLRAGGSYMLGNVLVLMALVISLGVSLSTGIVTWEQRLAFVTPIVMAVLAAETLANFITEIYRPRTTGQEPRAAFDSRLLGLIAAPERIARNIAEGLNYQFGFQVSQTWFAQLLLRAFLPLLWAGAATLWLLTTIVIVQPQERVIIEHWGRQVDAAQPLQPGFHWKLPWPIEIARFYNTGQLHEITVGFKVYNAEPSEDPKKAGQVVLWTDTEHQGQPHFDFLISPSPLAGGAAPATQPAATQPGASTAHAVNMIRMGVPVQFRIVPERLAQYTQKMSDPEELVRNIAWSEVTRYCASQTVDSLLGSKLAQVSEDLKQRIAKRVRDLDVGIEIVYVGMANVHPERTVSEAFRDVINAEQAKLTSIREALVVENERLSSVAGDKTKALLLAQAVGKSRDSSNALNAAEQVLRSSDPAATRALDEPLERLTPEFTRRAESRMQLEQARIALDQINQDLLLGLGRRMSEKAAAEAAVAAAEQADRAAESAEQQALEEFRRAAGRTLKPDVVDALIRRAQARCTREFSNRRLEQLFRGLEGGAARVLAEAQAERWRIEMARAAELVQVRNEREAYRRAPEIYKLRSYLEELVRGMAGARKFFLAFDRAGREVRLRLNVEEEAQPGLDNLPLTAPP